MEDKNKNQLEFSKLLLSLLICVGGGWLSGLVTEQAIADWYPQLIKPTGTPPNFVFPIVWTILYFMMGISFALLWSSPSKHKKSAVILFLLQLLLNFNWSWLFFGLKSPGIALVDLILLWAMLLATIIAVKKHTRLGAYLLITYLGWLTYALYLNFFIWLNN